MTVNKDEVRAAHKKFSLYGYSNAIPTKKAHEYIYTLLASDDAKEETIRQQAEEIERLKQTIRSGESQYLLLLEECEAAERELNILKRGSAKVVGDYADGLYEIDRLRAHNAALRECLAKVMRVTADGSLPDEWNGSTGGAGHAEIRKIVGRLLAELDRKDTQEGVSSDG